MTCPRIAALGIPLDSTVPYTTDNRKFAQDPAERGKKKRPFCFSERRVSADEVLQADGQKKKNNFKDRQKGAGRKQCK
jgi:hypothetical protein